MIEFKLHDYVLWYEERERIRYRYDDPTEPLVRRQYGIVSYIGERGEVFVTLMGRSWNIQAHEIVAKGRTRTELEQALVRLKEEGHPRELAIKRQMAELLSRKKR